MSMVRGVVAEVQTTGPDKPQVVQIMVPNLPSLRGMLSNNVIPSAPNNLISQREKQKLGAITCVRAQIRWQN